MVIRMNLSQTSKGRLSPSDIEKMVREAEQCKAEDDKQKERIAAKNSLESYCFNIKSTLDEPQVQQKVPESDKTKILDKVNETLRWLDSNQMADTEEFSDKQKEVESICNPIITRLYQGAQGGAAQPGGCGRQSGNNFSAGPTVEEVD